MVEKPLWTIWTSVGLTIPNSQYREHKNHVPNHQLSSIIYHNSNRTLTYEDLWTNLAIYEAPPSGSGICSGIYLPNLGFFMMFSGWYWWSWHIKRALDMFRICLGISCVYSTEMKPAFMDKKYWYYLISWSFFTEVWYNYPFPRKRKSIDPSLGKFVVPSGNFT